MKTTKVYESDTVLGQGWGMRETQVSYFACTICYGVFPKTREGKKEAAACCAEHKTCKAEQ